MGRTVLGLPGYLSAVCYRKTSERTRAAYRELLGAVVTDGHTTARAYGLGGWRPTYSPEPYDGPRELFDAAALARADRGVVWVSDVNHNGTLLGPVGNLAFRAHHDAIHVLRERDFSLTGECFTAADTLDTLDLSPDASAVLVGEVVGQAMYYDETGEFPTHTNGKQPVFHVTPESVAWALGTIEPFTFGDL